MCTMHICKELITVINIPKILLRLTLEQHGGWGTNPPCCRKSTNNLQWPPTSEVLYLWIQPTVDCGSTIVFTIGKKSTYKWNCAIQTCVIKESTVLLQPQNTTFGKQALG